MQAHGPITSGRTLEELYDKYISYNVKPTPPKPALEITRLGSGVECNSPKGVTIMCKDHPNTKRTINYHCHRPECPRCSGYWAYMRAERMRQRLEAAEYLYSAQSHAIGKPIHVSLHPPQSLIKTHLNTAQGYRTLRSQATDIMRSAGFEGGAVLFHAYRGEEYSPHFHLVGWGFLRNSKAFYKCTGWTYTNHGRRNDLRRLLNYLTRRSAVIRSNGTRIMPVTWIGSTSCNKILKGKEHRELVEEYCPECGQEMLLVKDDTCYGVHMSVRTWHEYRLKGSRTKWKGG